MAKSYIRGTNVVVKHYKLNLTKNELLVLRTIVAPQDGWPPHLGPTAAGFAKRSMTFKVRALSRLANG